jgi:hypothetical protein
MNKDYPAILLRRYAGAQWSMTGDDYADLEWLDDSDKPSEEELDAQWTSVQAEIKQEKTAKIEAKAALLERLGITAEEAALLLG